MLEKVYKQIDINKIEANENQPRKVFDDEKIEELAFHGDNDIRNIIKDSKLQYKINEDKGNSAFAILFMPNSNKEKLPYNHLEVVDFMIEVLIESVFE